MWTTWVRERAVRTLPPDCSGRPTTQFLRVVLGVPSSVWQRSRHSSSSRVRTILRLKGPECGASPGSASLFHDIHLWSVEIFFFATVRFTSGANSSWRHGGGGRGRAYDLVRPSGRFLVSIGAAFTGYLSQQNFDSQWISQRGQGQPNLQRGRLRPDVHLSGLERLFLFSSSSLGAAALRRESEQAAKGPS